MQPCVFEILVSPLEQFEFRSLAYGLVAQ